MSSEICNCVSAHTSRMNRDGYVELADPNCQECGGTGHIPVIPNKCDIVVCRSKVAWTSPRGTNLCSEHADEYRHVSEEHRKRAEIANGPMTEREHQIWLHGYHTAEDKWKERAR